MSAGDLNMIKGGAVDSVDSVKCCKCCKKDAVDPVKNTPRQG